MQERFDFVASDLARWRSRLVPLLDGITVLPRRKPIGQLVKSLISGRTKDAVSLAAYRKLGQRFGSAAALGAAAPVGAGDLSQAASRANRAPPANVEVSLLRLINSVSR